LIGGTRGSLTIPYLDLWRNNAAPGWMEPIERQRLAVEAEDPLALQVRNFCDVIRGVAQPVVSGREGLATLKVIAAVKQAAATGGTVDVV
jgi:predicted dehydrogenase